VYYFLAFDSALGYSREYQFLHSTTILSDPLCAASGEVTNSLILRFVLSHCRTDYSLLRTDEGTEIMYRSLPNAGCYSHDFSWLQGSIFLIPLHAVR